MTAHLEIGPATYQGILFLFDLLLSYLLLLSQFPCFYYSFGIICIQFCQDSVLVCLQQTNHSKYTNHLLLNTISNRPGSYEFYRGWCHLQIVLKMSTPDVYASHWYRSGRSRGLGKSLVGCHMQLSCSLSILLTTTGNITFHSHLPTIQVTLKPVIGHTSYAIFV